MDLLPTGVEHAVHEFVPILEVCSLRRVSKLWRSRVDKALRLMPWDLTNFEDMDEDRARECLERLFEMGVRVRSLVLKKVCVFVTTPRQSMIVKQFSLPAKDTSLSYLRAINPTRKSLACEANKKTCFKNLCSFEETRLGGRGNPL